MNRSVPIRPRGRILALLLLTLAAAIPAAEEDVYTGGVVAADHPIAAAAGREMLEGGGNAADAAVATAFCLSVVRPYSCGLGGGGFWLVHLAAENRTIAVDCRERAPSAVGPDYYENLPDTLASLVGAHSIGIPGMAAGALHVLEKYGSLERAVVLAPAIRAAEEGFVVDAHYAEAAAATAALFEEKPSWKETYRFLWERFLGRGGIREGDMLRLPEQAKALRLIAESGAGAYYGGPIGEAVAAAVAEGGGVLGRDDLAAFDARELKPLEGVFTGKRLLTMPPPSSGGITLLEILGIFDRAMGGEIPEFHSSLHIHLLAEAIKHGFADRAEWLGDPVFTEVPSERLLSGPYLDERAALVDRKRTKKPEAYGTRAAPPDDGGTSHFSVVDARGNGVSATESINNDFGSYVAVEEFGFLLNDTMDDFTTRPGKANLYRLRQSEGNRPEPGKRPLSSMSPTIVLDDEGIFAAAGGSGGPRIITGTLQCLLNVMLYGMDAGEAVAAGRFHHQWMPNTLWLEPGFDKETQQGLFGKGHGLSSIPTVAAVQLIRRVEGGYQGAGDPRKGGAALGRNR
ncbi:MAG: gamma-glutamyltransferase [Candidatus Eisenbacteria bacterium]